MAAGQRAGEEYCAVRCIAEAEGVGDEMQPDGHHAAYISYRDRLTGWRGAKKPQSIDKRGMNDSVVADGPACGDASTHSKLPMGPHDLRPRVTPVRLI